MIRSPSDQALAGVVVFFDTEPWTVPEAARMLKVPERSLRNYIRDWVRGDRVFRLDRGVYRVTLPAADDARCLAALWDGEDAT